MQDYYETRMPEAIEVEKKLLSALMRDDSRIDEVAAVLTVSDFYRAEHRLIYKALLRLQEEGVPANAPLVEESLRQSGDYERVTHNYIFSLAILEFTALRVDEYVKIIQEKSARRRLIQMAQTTLEAAIDDRNSSEEVQKYAEAELLNIANRKKQSTVEKAGVIVQRSFERAEKLRNDPASGLGVKSGLIDLDKILNGFQKSDMILLAARPSMGKTALALNMAMNASREKIVLLFSLEMSKMQLGNRLLSTASGVNSMQLNSGNFADTDMDALVDGVDDVSNCQLYIDDTAGITLPEMRSKVRRLKHEQGVDLIIIDYLQLMTGGKAENRQQEISAISRKLKAMAREMDVPILALSQLSRGVELRAEKKPQLSDLRESGSLEQDADIVMFLYRDEYYNRDEAENKNIAELIIAKNRNGPTTSIHLQFDKETMRFSNLTRAEY